MLRRYMGHIAALIAMVLLSAAVTLYVSVHERTATARTEASACTNWQIPG